jgi:hypothetical protein
MTHIDVILRGRLLARYPVEPHGSTDIQTQRARAVQAAKQTIIDENLVDDAHLDDLSFEFHEP